MLRLSDFDAVTFDVYGTLIDWEPSIAVFLADWAAKSGVTATSNEMIMSFDRARAAIQKERPAHLYPEVLRRCFDRISNDFGVAVDFDRREEFAATPHHWPAFSDVPSGLKRLQAVAKVGALSNIDNASLASSCGKMDIAFDILVTAERVGAYKPSLEHFDTALADLDAMGIARSRVLHVGQSLRADITPANKLGLKCVWINRPNRLLGLSGEGAAEARPDLTVSSLAEMLEAIG
ncbi:HAD-IA family hydrolase [Azospirillum brasilense]|uniref:HAD-IA family hydrolase n=1 Tax=Azospirillum brasilense TaxID=192 RepID=UPI000E6A3DF9|nr:HAD-IA family hydrolase [Azospirillum brasilense]NUB28128.1 HAD-IA family hydrolase [Azospirillum brasilense]NUB33235.1 HAD-IA family hydrolase [Azospirillum brasilense]RIW00155.1 haloacid dehalogenase [Azospirillum brasilense]